MGAVADPMAARRWLTCLVFWHYLACWLPLGRRFRRDQLARASGLVLACCLLCDLWLPVGIAGPEDCRALHQNSAFLALPILALAGAHMAGRSADPTLMNAITRRSPVLRDHSVGFIAFSLLVVSCYWAQQASSGCVNQPVAATGAQSVSGWAIWSKKTPRRACLTWRVAIFSVQTIALILKRGIVRLAADARQCGRKAERAAHQQLSLGVYDAVRDFLGRCVRASWMISPGQAIHTLMRNGLEERGINQPSRMANR